MLRKDRLLLSFSTSTTVLCQRQLPIFALCVLARRATATKALLSTESSQALCFKAAILRTVMYVYSKAQVSYPRCL